MLETERIWLITAIAFITLLLNLPFGYMRHKARKYSLWWLFCIHIPVPFIILIRVLFGLDYRVIPVFILAAVTGQFFGGRIHRA